jgi:hypothetical protein
MLPEPLIAALLVVEILERLDVPYFIGGSLASTVYGLLRTTMDADLVADLRLEHVNPFVASLGSAFYVDEEAIQDAIIHRSSFNVIHLDTMFKVDVFIPHNRPFDKQQFERRVAQRAFRDTERSAYFAGPEDTVLTKLEWFRMGGEVSERQWRDVIGVLRVQRDRLDMSYMRQWAGSLGVLDLLDRALAEATC